MQPKRITVQKALSQRPDPNYNDSVPKLSALQAPFRDPSTGVPQHEFAAGDFASEEFPSGDFSPMDYALPDSINPRVFRLIGAEAAKSEASVRARSFYDLSKRGLDITVSLSLLLLASPILMVIAIMVKATSRGPAFFSHRRLGHNGKEFDCLKFRTMSADAEQRLKQDAKLRQRFEEKFKLEDDPRITPLGAFLRRTSLDELPQLFHVLRGEMSLVGPRPIVEDELGKYSIYANKLLSVKPGLSGLWQVCGRSDTTYPQRVMMDMHYIDHRSLSLDVQLLLLTASAVIRKSGAW
jgi:lipopolysaccharide/colanic/teichoic acid biosynthesis glycosyltransferase